MSTPKPIFAYLKELSLSKQVLNKIRRAGYLPVEVSDFSLFKIIDPFPDLEFDKVARAAIATIADSDGPYSEVQRRFGSKLAKRLSVVQPSATAEKEANKS